MATIVLVLVFVLLGLGVWFVAFSGGPVGARTRLRSQSRASRRLAVVSFIVALVVLGLGVPAGVIALVDNRDSIPQANVSNLTASEKHGRELFGRRCAACHTLKAANAEAEVGPDLDELRPPKALILDAIQKGRARGNGQMAADLVEGQDADDVAAFVAKSVGQSTSSSK